MVAVAAAVAMVPVVAGVAAALSTPWVGMGDWALIELTVRDVGGADTPLIGAYSRFGWHHPGPLPYYVLALPYRLAPPDHGLLFAASAVNLAAMGAAVTLACRYPWRLALAVLTGLTMFTAGLGAAALRDPWNPTIALVPFALFVVLCLEMAHRRSRWAGPAAVFVGSFCIQAHAGFALPVVTIGVAAPLVGLWLRRRASEAEAPPDPAPTPSRSARFVTAGVAAGVAVAAWAAPVADQLTGSGNLGRLVRWSLGDDLDREPGRLERGGVGLAEVPDRLAWLLHPAGLWLGRVRGTAVPWGSHSQTIPATSPAWTVVVVGLVVVATVVCFRRTTVTSTAGRRHAPAAVVVALAAVGILAALIGLATNRGAAYLYSFRWVAVIAATIWIGSGYAALTWLGARFMSSRVARSTSPERWRLAAGGVVVALGLGIAVHGARPTTWGEGPRSSFSRSLRDLQPAVAEVIETEGRVVVDTSGLALLISYDSSLAVMVERAGGTRLDPHDSSVGAERYSITSSARFDPVSMDPVARSTSSDPDDPDLVLVRLDG